tara:strand:+ start:175 stop:639 length:465 start_codon:yes stop_codon:yes gene_type:complete
MGFALQVPVLKTEMKNSSVGPLFVTRLNGATIMATCYSTPSSPFHILKAWSFEKVTGGPQLTDRRRNRQSGTANKPTGVQAKRIVSMKRQKRSRDERAYSRGYLAGFQGRPRDFCPFGALQARTHWMSGWREGRTNQVQGMVGVAGIQNLKDVT